jgi:hypothetical protein
LRDHRNRNREFLFRLAVAMGMTVALFCAPKLIAANGVYAPNARAAETIPAKSPPAWTPFAAR